MVQQVINLWRLMSQSLIKKHVRSTGGSHTPPQGWCAQGVVEDFVRYKVNSGEIITRAWGQRGVSGILGEYEFFISK